MVKYIPYAFILLFNLLIESIYPNNTLVLVPNIILVLSVFSYFLITKLKNIYNQIISNAWLIFFFLGVLNINSVKTRTDMWDLKLLNPSLLYYFCLLIFIISLFFFEKLKTKNIKFINDDKSLFNTPFSYLIIVYPVLLLLTIYINLGFFPILSGASFVNEMYEYNYGFLYKYKFITLYSSCLIVLIYARNKRVLFTTIYVLFLMFVLSVDGKRFMLLLSITSIIPILLAINNTNKDGVNKTPIIVAFVSVGVLYLLLNIFRTGGDVLESLSLIVENIPFGVEYKDYVHCFNTYSPTNLKGYNFEQSAMGSFLNSSILEVFNENKVELYQKGSQHALMNLYNEKFGIRVGIIAEIYFAYGLFVLPIMSLIAFFVNRISNNLVKPKSYFSLIQNSILFGLFFLLINGQATVFFGSLTMIIYIYILYSISKYFKFKISLFKKTSK